MSKLKSNPIIAALERNESAVQIAGYVSQSQDGQIRLYTKLDLAGYLVIDSSDIIQVLEADRDEEPTRLFIRDSAEIKVVSTVKAVALRKQDNAGKGAGGKSCADKSFDVWWECVQTSDDLEWCRLLSILAQNICEVTESVNIPTTATRK